MPYSAVSKSIRMSLKDRSCYVKNKSVFVVIKIKRCTSLRVKILTTF
jgi:hypothetical protein